MEHSWALEKYYGHWIYLNFSGKTYFSVDAEFDATVAEIKTKRLIDLNLRFL